MASGHYTVILMSNILYVFFISMLPILELRASIPVGYAFGFPIILNIFISVIGNMLPIPFILIFINKILHFMSHSKISFFNKTAGFVLTEEDPDIVLLGFDTTLNYEKLKKACQYIRNGCIYFGMNEDLNCPMEGGTFIPDCGSMARLIEASTGRFPEFFGKPSKYTLDYIIKETGYKPEEIAIVGDRLYTDIAVADGSEVTSILVLSGESSREDVEKSDIKPDYIVKDLSEIIR